jgi:hypothetical protein
MANHENNKELLEVNFPKLSHFWMDSGLVGLYKIAKEENSSEMNVEIQLTDDYLTFKGSETNLTALFEKTCWSLLDQYYNKSTEKQIQENSGFYYDSKEDRFVRFPKVQAMGIAGLIFSKAARKTGEAISIVEVNEVGTKIKKKVLPPEYSHLQNRLDFFLSETGLKLADKMLIDGPYAVKPKVNIKVKQGKEKGKCFICGESSHSLTNITGTVYPMITGPDGVLSFNSNVGKPEKVCWKCDFMSKFVPANGFYIYQIQNKSKSFHIYFPYSSSLIKMSEVYEDFESIKINHPKLLTNFENLLGSYFQRPYEQMFTFLYSIYRMVLCKKTCDDSSILDFEKLSGTMISKASLEFYIINTTSLGDNTQMGKMVWPFNDSVYMFRLFDKIEKNDMKMEDIMSNLIDYEQKENKTMLRNRICERILKKRSIIELIELHVFHINKSKKQYIKPIHDFTIFYEKILRESDDEMDQSIIDTAVSLGKTVGISAASAGSKKGKGDLFRLRRTRKPEDFLNEINRIQMKYGTLVTANLYSKGQDFEDNFLEFKQFCMIAALNAFNAGSKENNSKTKEEDKK